MKKAMEGQLSLWDILSEEAPKEMIPIHHAINVKSMPIKECNVSLAYGDLVLIVCMIEDYIKGLDVAMEGDFGWDVYYRSRFSKMSAEIQKKIEYDYAAKLEKCRKKQNKESNSDIGEEALSLAMKRAANSAKKDQSANNQNDEADVAKAD
ncbi:MAG: hypothetical protein IKO41_13460 [Lachnospiraceae bacterium]|nr:hypothetical protein [Lachnospiraceae bacterium]